MKTQLKTSVGILALILCAAQLYGQQRYGGGGGGGFGGFGGFGGGFGGNRGGFGGSSSSTSGQYNNNGTVGSATIEVDPDTHNIIVITDQQTSEQISNVIASLDRPKPQVLIKVVFMQVQLNNALDLGIEGGWTGPAGNSAVVSAANIFGLSGLNNVATNFNAQGQPIGNGFPTPSSGTTGAGGLYQIVGTDYQATIRALASKGKAQILSRPSVIARDGQPATILIGQQVPLITGISYESVGTGTVPINNVTYTPVGIQLNVTPYISPDNYVEMIVTPEDSQIDPTLSEPIGNGVNAPVIDTRSADTVVITPDSQTVVIGGLIENDKESNANQIPLLGDIPILGMLFRSKTSSNDKNELMIFMTPHIVHAPMELASTVNAPSLTSGMITNSVSEHQLDNFLQSIPEQKMKTVP